MARKRKTLLKEYMFEALINGFSEYFLNKLAVNSTVNVYMFINLPKIDSLINHVDFSKTQIEIDTTTGQRVNVGFSVNGLDMHIISMTRSLKQPSDILIKNKTFTDIDEIIDFIK